MIYPVMVVAVVIVVWTNFASMSDEDPTPNIVATVNEIPVETQSKPAPVAEGIFKDEPEPVKEEPKNSVDTEEELKKTLDVNQRLDFSIDEMYAYLSCAAERRKSRPPYTEEMWESLRKIYTEFAEKDEKKGSSVYNDEHVHFPIESYRTDSHGRSIRATRDIAQGELVFKDTRNTVVFTDAHSYRGYLYAIKEDTTFNDPGAACDLLKYSWAQKRVGTEEYVVMLNLDDGALMIDDDEDMNVKCDAVCDAYYATEDIKKGEEIVCNENHLIESGSWNKVPNAVKLLP